MEVKLGLGLSLRTLNLGELGTYEQECKEMRLGRELQTIQYLWALSVPHNHLEGPHS